MTCHLVELRTTIAAARTILGDTRAKGLLAKAYMQARDATETPDDEIYILARQIQQHVDAAGQCLHEPEEPDTQRVVAGLVNTAWIFACIAVKIASHRSKLN